MVFVVLGGLWLLPESRSDKGIPIDLVSAVLSVTAIMSVIYAIKVFAHDGPTVLSSVSLLAGIAAGGVFLRRQRALTAPLIDIDLFKRPASHGPLSPLFWRSSPYPDCCTSSPSTFSWCGAIPLFGRA